jgi:hypothetical protein
MGTRVVVTLTAADLDRERTNLERGSVVATGVTGLAVGAFCDVELVFPSGEKATFSARAVLTTADGTVFAFDAFDRSAIDRHLGAPATSATAAPPTATAAAPALAPADEHPAEEAEVEESQRSATVEERLRRLSVAEQLRFAREGSLAERVALERLYGKIVWETLLHNARITVPEVARLAKMGTMPRPLMELIVANPAWLQVPQIRRALLSNPRLPQEMIQRVLSLLPRSELKLVPQASAYPPAVRAAAKAMVQK